MSPVEDREIKERKKLMIADQIYRKYLTLDEVEALSYDLEILQADINNMADSIFPDQLNEEDKWEIYQRLRLKIDVVVLEAKVLTDPNKKYNDWYTDEFIANLDEFYWNRFNKLLEDHTTIPKAVIRRVNTDSTRIVKKLGNPKGEPFLTKGMVVGNVQAGKTLSYSAVINKAIDAGYILVIILAGTTETLRAQTQKRINKDVIGKTFVDNEAEGLERLIGVGLIDSLKGFATVVTSEKNDFNLRRRISIDLDQQIAPAAIVAKKNASVLKDINKWLSSSKKRTNIPVLIIDDEADNASVNTAKDDEDPKAINREIRNILQNCSRVTYLAYTATPMANIFIKPDEYNNGDMEDLFPSDFLVGLQAPTNYCGGEFFFTNEETSENAIEFIDDNKHLLPIKHKKTDPLSKLPNSLIEAIEYFFIASSIKDSRRQSGQIDVANSDNNFDTCLINISVYQTRQNDIKPIIQLEVDRIYHAIQAYAGMRNIKNDSLDRLKKVFDQKINDKTHLVWEEVLANMVSMEKPQVLSINGGSPDRLEWDLKLFTKAIVVGGYILSRGLTLPGLTVSYILRNSQAYDTLMQMGRWFGYRDGYRDLVKLWCSPISFKNYSHITEVLSEFNGMITSMERDKLGPRDFGLRIRSHPDLLVTAKNRMRSAIEWEEFASFAGSHNQTFVFDKDPAVQEANNNYAMALLKGIKDKRVQSNSNQNHIIFQKIPSGDILSFLRDYKIHQYNGRFGDHDLFMRYLQKHEFGILKEWDVAIFVKKAGTSIVPSIKSLFDEEIIYEDRSIYDGEGFPKGKNCIFLSARRSIGAANTVLVGLDEKLTRHDRVRPILIFHFLNAKLSDRIDTPEELKKYKDSKFTGITIILPGNNDESDNVKYKVTQKYFDDHFITGNIGEDFEEYEQ
jgi:hypothetical protein